MKAKIRIEYGVVKSVIVTDGTRGLMSCGCFIQENGTLVMCREHEKAIINQGHDYWTRLVSQIKH